MLIFIGAMPSLRGISGKRPLEVEPKFDQKTKLVQINAFNREGWLHADELIGEELVKEDRERYTERLVYKWWRAPTVFDTLPYLMIDNSKECCLYNRHTKLIIREMDSILELLILRYVRDQTLTAQREPGRVNSAVLFEQPDRNFTELSGATLRMVLDRAKAEAIPGVSVKSDRMRPFIQFVSRITSLSDWQRRGLTFFYGE